jgi:hypothetical protein
MYIPSVSFTITGLARDGKINKIMKYKTRIGNQVREFKRAEIGIEETEKEKKGIALAPMQHSFPTIWFQSA